MVSLFVLVTFSSTIRCLERFAVLGQLNGLGQTYWPPRSGKLLRSAHPLVLPHVSHFSQVPFRTIVKFWHSEPHVARIALGNGAHAAVGFEFSWLPSWRGGVGGGLVGEEGGGVLTGLVHQFLGDLLGQFGGAFLVIALEGDDFGGGDGGDRFQLAGGIAGKGGDGGAAGSLCGSSGRSPLRLGQRPVNIAARDQRRLVPRVQPVEIRLVLPS